VTGAGVTPGSRWTDRDGHPADVPEPPPGGSYYGPIGDFQGAEYERNAFALGTAAEVDFLWGHLDLAAAGHVADIGCGNGRHTRELARRGLAVTGVDLSAGLLRVGAAAGLGAYVQADARALPLPDRSCDVVLCLCQGGFGITPGSDRVVLGELARILRPGGRLALTAFSLVFAVRWLAPEDHLDVRRGLVHSPAEVRGPDGARRTFDLWTSCYSADHLALLVEEAGLRLDSVSGVEPGRYGLGAPALTDPELLVIATRR
jgi:SAM-dependent methyltransferase